jgi:hypothetical protein
MMIVGVYATLGVFLLIASRNPQAHRSLIWFTVWSSVVHAVIMAAQAIADAAERGHLVGDVPALLVDEGVQAVGAIVGTRVRGDALQLYLRLDAWAKRSWRRTIRCDGVVRWRATGEPFGHALLHRQHPGLLPFADERVANLSYAQQKLLVVVTLVARDDPLILLDELAAGLDHDSVAAFSRLVREMAASGRTVCLIEHNLDFVWQTADTVLVLDQGRLIAEGTPEQIQRDRHVAEIYFGSARAVDA